MKTITLKLEDEIYNMFEIASKGENRSLNHFIQEATMNYLLNQMVVDDQEMEEILKDKDLLTNLKQGEEDIKQERYRVVE